MDRLVFWFHFQRSLNSWYINQSVQTDVCHVETDECDISIRHQHIYMFDREEIEKNQIVFECKWKLYSSDAEIMEDIKFLGIEGVYFANSIISSIWYYSYGRLYMVFLWSSKYAFMF